jgi:hypothetical protein
MNAFVARIPAVDPLLKPTPEDADPRIVQPTGVIERFCFILRKTSAGNNVYRCKICSHEFTGSKVVAATHMICLRDKIMQIEEEVLENALLAVDEENLDDLDEIIPANEFDDAEYNAEIDDQGINALMLLLNAAEQIEE